MDGAFQKVFIEDPTLEEIIQGLYDVPGGLASYDFSAIDADILGAVYEQYLGHVTQIVRRRAQEIQLRLDRGFSEEQAWEEVVKVIQRPRGRREQGVYYTPKWVTDYIVRETVGKFIEEHAKMPEAIHDVKILDMACGSGSFLIRAYDELLKWHSEAVGRAESEIDPHERTLILGNNIFGVDLDPQAVEIARLNLMLRALALRETLPSLADNIRVGNSLISGNKEELRPYFEDKWGDKRPFNWNREYREIMDNGGFDIIVGNPPYVRIQNVDRDEASYYGQNYQSATGNYDLYVLFVEQGLQLLKPGGVLGFILPNKFLQTTYGRGIRKRLSTDKLVTKVVDFGDAQVFGAGTTYTALLFLKKQQNDFAMYLDAHKFPEQRYLRDLGELESAALRVESSQLTDMPWLFRTPKVEALMRQTESKGTPLSHVADRIFQGLKTSADSVYVLAKVRKDKGNLICFSEALNKEIRLEQGLLRPLIKGHEMRRYWINEPDKVILLPYDGTALIESEDLLRLFPLTAEYLEENRAALEGRERGRMRDKPGWYGYIYPKNLIAVGLPKIVTPDVAETARYSWDKGGEYAFSGGAAGGYGITLKDGYGYEYVLGLLNSKLLDWYLHRLSSHFRGGYYSYEARFIRQLPIRNIDFSYAADKQLHDTITDKVGEMLTIQERLENVHDLPTHEREELQREAEHLDSDIDALVYELYGLTKAERQLVEEG